MSCSSCKYLNENMKREGAVTGACYFCTKVEKYVNGTNDNCNEFLRGYRSCYVCNEIYENGEKYYDDGTDIGLYVILLGILIIIAIFVNV